jgi:hypothetical protein
MSYSSSDQKAFRAQAVQDGRAIWQLISTSSLDTGATILYLLERNIVSCEDLIGIEHMIGGSTMIAVRSVRRTHAQLVLSSDFAEGSSRKERRQCEKDCEGLESKQFRECQESSILSYVGGLGC